MSNSNNNNENPWRRYAATSLPANKINERTPGVASVPSPITIAAAQDQRRRISITTLGLPNISPSQASLYSSGSRRGSADDDADENAIEDDDGGRSIPATPFIRRMSLGAQAIRSTRGGNSPRAIGEVTSFNISEQFKKRAESSVSQNQRPSFSFPSRYTGPPHRRAASITEMPAPPSLVPPPTSDQSRPAAPDEFQERMLKGHFYMD